MVSQFLQGGKVLNKYQPKISEKNSVRLCEIPNSVLDVSVWLDLKQLELFDTFFSSSYKILYVISNNSSKSRLHPVRDENKRFLVIITLAK